MIKHKLTVFLGDVQEYLGQLAKKHDASAWLLDRNNYYNVDTELKNNNVTIYTSLSEFSNDLDNLIHILSKADVIFYRPPVRWSDNKTVDLTEPGNSIQGLTEIILLLLPGSVEIKGLTAFTPADYDPNPLIDTRKTEESQLWIAGCSISHGIGVNTDERYGHLLAKHLGLDYSSLTRSGSAIDWAADQILRSDIRAGDLVVWGLTSWNRLTYIHDNTLLQGVTAGSYVRYPEYQKIVDLDNLCSSQTLYNHYYSIKRVINYCKKIDAKLVLVGLLHNNYSLLGFLKSLDNYIHIPYKMSFNHGTIESFEDLGTDKKHPGPKQHQIYKNFILDFIKAN